MQGGYGAVFGVMVQIFWPIRVSRYNCTKWLEICQDTGAYKMCTGAVSRYKRTTEPGISHVTKSLIACTGAESGWNDNRVII